MSTTHCIECATGGFLHNGWIILPAVDQVCKACLKSEVLLVDSANDRRSMALMGRLASTDRHGNTGSGQLLARDCMTCVAVPEQHPV